METINIDTLQNNPNQLILPNQPNDTTAQSIINSSGADSAFSIEKTKAEKAKDASTADFSKLLADISTEEAKKGQYETALGVDTRQTQLDELDQAIYNTSRSYKKYVDDLYKDPNVVGDVRGRRITEEQRRVAGALADMEFRKASIEGNIDKMKEKAQQIVDLKVAPLKAKAEMAKFTLEKNWDYLSDVQKSQLTEVSKKADREAKAEEERLTKGNEMIINALQSKAPQSLIDKAKNVIVNGGSYTDVAGVLGKYSLSESDRLENSIKTAQLAKLNKELIGTGGDQNAIDLGQKLSNINSIMASPAINSVVGTSLFSRGAGTFGGVIARFLTGFTGGAGVGALAGSVVPGVGTAVGALGGGIIGGVSMASKGAVDALSGERQELIGSVEQLVQQEFLDKLINVKAKGATFGALSNEEGRALREAATKIGNWRKTNKKGEVIGYNASEKSFEKEMNTLLDLTQKAYVRAGGNLDDLMPLTQEEYLREIDKSLSGNEYSQAGYIN